MYLPVTERPDHRLHLYTSKVDKYTIQKAFLASMKDHDRAVIVSYDDPEALRREFNLANLKILRWEEIGSLELKINEASRTRLIIDAGSFVGQSESEIEKRESLLNEIVKKYSLQCLCTYKVNELSRSTLKQLTAFHNQLQLTTSDITLISGDFIDRSLLSNDSIEKMVKDNLEALILALLQGKAMCGSDIIGQIHTEFNVLLSPGSVYPLLHSLQRRGLLTYLREGKEKRYKPTEDSEIEIRHLVYEHIQARKMLNNYLQKELEVEHDEPTVHVRPPTLEQQTN